MDRTLAAVVALAATAGLVAQFAVSLRLSGGAAAALWAMGGYFTVLTNLALALALGRHALGRSLRSSGAAAVTVAILVVGVVYHAVLAGLWQPEGLQWLADQLLHSATPVLTALWWLAAAPKRGLGLRSLGAILAGPALYLGYALLREVATGFVPYPFLDLAARGTGGVALNALGVLAVVLALAAGLIGLGRALSR